ncbi:jg15890 [Pararge aegeria aegeria]|uniref:Jg15890 protein n=1 Tax=Pararge aegeria aegeria TaxID=348720 RepID=A0A8S4SLI7_9NEOP|nr:jg15890 [Pararge aegeria aegeria]
MSGAHSSENRWKLGFQGAGMATPRKPSVGRPPTRWTDVIQRVAGGRWEETAEDRVFWNSLQKTYVQQWTSIG